MANLKLRFLHGQRRGEELSYTEPRLTVGRSHDNDLVLPGGQSTASGRHAELTFKGGRWWVADMGSTNGTYVNDERLSPGERRGLRNKDRLGFGGAPMLLVTLPEGTPWGPVAGLVLVVAILALLGYRELGRVDRGFESAATQVARSVYLIAVESGDGRRALASAFAVGANGLLATTAHVAADLDRRGTLSGDRDLRAVALLTDTEATPLPIVSAYLHPEHEPDTFRNDVALLQVEVEQPLAALSLAAASELTGLERGVELGVFGFPARTTDAGAPRGRFIEATLGDVREGRYLEIGRGITPGMSGSPIFTREGRVVGIVVGGELDQPQNQGEGNWGLSVAALKEMLEEH